MGYYSSSSLLPSVSRTNNTAGTAALWPLQSSGTCTYTTDTCTSTIAWFSSLIPPTFTSENYKKFKEKLTQTLKKQV